MKISILHRIYVRYEKNVNVNVFIKNVFMKIKNSTFS